MRNKVLAVDISIWLTQFVKAMRDAEGAQVRNAHLLGVFRRCIKLLYLSVRPVLVFDGATPALKRKTLAGRRAMRDRHEAKLRRLAERMLVNRMKISVLGAAIRTKRKRSTANGNARSAKTKQLTNDLANIRQAPAAGPSSEETGKQQSREEMEEEEEDSIQPVHTSDTVKDRTPDKEKTIPPEVVRMQEVEDAIFAADLADEEEAMNRQRDAAPIDMPYDVHDIDDGTLQDLPPTMQSEIFKQIKFNQRARHRERMLLQKNDPAQFSRAQIEGFLQNTALNRKIRSARSALNDKSGASNRIASDSKRQFVLEDKNEPSLNGEDGFSGDGSSDDDFLADGREPRRRNLANAAPDILAQLRAKRDAELGVSSAMREECNQTRRENNQKRSGVGWASRVLEGKGGLVLGGRSALGASSREATKVMSESDSESWEDARCSESVRANGTRDKAIARVESEDDDSDEWEDGDAVVLPSDSREAPDVGCSFDEENLLNSNEVSVEHSSRRKNTEPQFANASAKKDDLDEMEKQTSQGNCGTGFADFNEIPEVGKVEKRELPVQKRRRGLFDLDASSDGDSELLEEPAVESSPRAEPNESGCLENENEKSSAAGEGKTQAQASGGMNEQENVKKPEISGHTRRRDLIDLDAVSDEDVKILEERVVHCSPPANENTPMSQLKDLSKECMASGGTRNASSEAELPREDKLKSEQPRKKLSPALDEVATVIGNSGHVIQPGVPDTLQGCRDSVPRVQHGPDRSDPVKPPTETPSSTIEQEVRAQVSKASKRVKFQDENITTQPQLVVESMEELKSAPHLDSADGDVLVSRDAPDNHATVTPQKRKGDDEEHEDLQLAIALSLQDRKSQGPPTAREPKAGIIEEGTSHLSLHRRRERGTFQTEQAKGSGGLLDSEPVDVGNAVEQKTADSMPIVAKISSSKDQTSNNFKQNDRTDDTIQADGRQSDAHADEVAAVQGEEVRHFEATEMSTERMQELRDELEIEERELQRQKSSHQGGAESVSEEMYGEARDLLKLFGIPYLEAPEEAEAQCAFLNKERVVDGVITEDSDAFLFGAQTVYRKLFSEGQFAEAYEARHIHSKLGLDRDLLIRLAYLLGSDYTVGVRGVGVVNSMEVLEAFPGENGLEEFRDWTKKVTVFDEQPEEEVMTGKSPEAIRRRFCWKHRNMKRNWEIRPEFPNEAVAKAYLRPKIDPSTGRFRWGRVDFSGLRTFCWEKFGWEEDRFEVAVGPLRQKLKDYRAERGQTRIDEFFKPHRFAKIRSVRLQTAVTGMVGAEAADLMADTLGRPKVKRRKTAAVANVAVDSDDEKEMMAAVEQAERKLSEIKRRGK